MTGRGTTEHTCVGCGATVTIAGWTDQPVRCQDCLTRTCAGWVTYGSPPFVSGAGPCAARVESGERYCDKHKERS